MAPRGMRSKIFIKSKCFSWLVKYKIPSMLFIVLLLVNQIEERAWWLIQRPKKRKKEESERLRGERDQTKFIDQALLSFIQN